MKVLFVLTNIFFEINVNIMQLTHKFDIKFKIYKLIINIDKVQHNLIFYYTF